MDTAIYILTAISKKNLTPHYGVTQPIGSLSISFSDVHLFQVCDFLCSRGIPDVVIENMRQQKVSGPLIQSGHNILINNPDGT